MAPLPAKYEVKALAPALAAAVTSDPRPLLVGPAPALLSLLSWRAYHMALRDRRRDS